MPKDYNETLNLPHTDFPMRASLSEKEPEILKKWKERDIYKNLINKNNNRPVYILLDGPPYANGDIHLGHALNKILKDFVVRFKNMSGYKAPYIPGWDTHGLPTELKARARAGISGSESIPDVELRKICKEFAMMYVNNQREQFKRLGIIGDWENPYITLQPEYEKAQIENFAQMASSGLIYRGMRPVYWCSNCETALAEAEIEYNDDQCNSIYVKFQVTDDKGKLTKMGAELSNTYFVIWTTTAWTLPGNVAICLGPDLEYALVKAENNFYIIACALVEKSMQAAGVDDYNIIGKLLGKEFEYMKAKHPFLKKDSLVIVGDHVTLESGTGCVHTAPGHGVEDFEVCKNYENLPIVVPVNSRGVLTDEAGMFSGLHISKAGSKITDYLKDHGLLFAVHEITHQYPHCWRCKSPILFRATEQWFCSIDKFREKALCEVDNVEWIPAWGRDRMSSMISERKDWCISRQRKWGTPIPIFFCKQCNNPLIDKESMLLTAEIFGREGSDSWFARPAKDFIKDGTRCKECGSSEFIKEKDIMDVWFDSGVAHAAVCNKKNNIKLPVDLCLEGADQYRGWFQSLLLTAIASNGKAPYKAVVTHGWVMDEEGKKQSKSLGNGVSPIEVVNKYGADILRLWVASADYHSDIKISYDILKQLSESYRKIRNTARYIIGNLSDFDPNKDMCDPKELFGIDKWAVMKLNELIKKCMNSYDKFEFHNVYHSIKRFCIVDMSNFYLDVLKERLYVHEKDGKERRLAQTTIYIILDALTRLLSPILSYTSEEIWKYMPHRATDNILSIILNDMPEVYKINTDEDFMRYWERIGNIREEMKKLLEEARKNKIIGSSLDAEVILYCKEESYNFIHLAHKDLKTAIIVSKLTVLNEGVGEKIVDGLDGATATIKHAGGGKCSRCWMYSDSVGSNKEHSELCGKCVDILK